MLSSPRSPSRTIRIFSSAEKTASRLALNVADDLLRTLCLTHQVLLPVGPEVSPISNPQLVQLQLNPNTRWRPHYNEVRPHSSLDDLTPMEFKKTTTQTAGAISQ